MHHRMLLEISRLSLVLALCHEDLSVHIGTPQAAKPNAGLAPQQRQGKHMMAPLWGRWQSKRGRQHRAVV